MEIRTCLYLLMSTSKDLTLVCSLLLDLGVAMLLGPSGGRGVFDVDKQQACDTSIIGQTTFRRMTG